mmetsp:Transcript_12096/g.13669  ORF Transcript_12096/g.13669 Transcript_12096/m.13669 type:complete len:208 (+) Transcript_12096:63-686(+)
MKLTNSISTVLWVVSVVSLLLLLQPGEVSAAWGWGSSSNTAATKEEVNEVQSNNNNEDPAAAAAADVVVASSLPTVVNSRTLESIISNEKRFVLYNSRRLTGECLPICAEDTPKGPQLKTTITPTNSPTLTTTFPPTTTFSPVSWSKGQEETLPINFDGKVVTFGPTGFPTTVATKNPPADPTEGPIAVGETEDTFGPKDKKKKKNQ